MTNPAPFPGCEIQYDYLVGDRLPHTEVFL